MSGPLGSSQWMYASGYEIEQSLRFNDDDDAYLSKTFTSAGNRRTWTWSSWVKRGNLVNGSLFACNGGGSDAAYTRIAFHDNSSILVTGNNTVWKLTDGTQHFRDISSWYHIVVALDTTDSTAANRLKIYVNGSILTSFSHNNAPDQNEELGINTAEQHHIGSAGNANSPTVELDGYLAEVNFIDGTALTPASFGETDPNGNWIAKEYGGSYGTNGFYLPFKNDYSVEGFSTVTYRGSGGARYIGGVGFQPDFVWIKRRNGNGSHRLTDAVRGASVNLQTDEDVAEATGNNCTAFNPDGFTVGGNSDDSGDDYVVWNWDMGGTNATNNDGSITSTVRANSTYGQSIVSYTGTGSNATVGHGLSAAPDMIIVKARTEPTGGVHFGSDQGNWVVYHSAIAGDAETDYILLNSTAAAVDSAAAWNDTAPTSSVFSISTVVDLNESSDTYIAYCFHDVTGYSKFGTYDGDGTHDGSNAVNTGFEPAFVMIKCTNDAESWWMFDNMRNPLNGGDDPKRIAADSSGAETTGGSTGSDWVEFTATGFKLTGQGGGTNGGSGQKYIYMAFADKREYGYWLDQSGNNNDWTSNNLQESDISLDTPSNNFAVLSPITIRTVNTPTVAFSEGNTRAVLPIYSETYSNMYPITGKWYYEVFIENEVYAQTIYGAAPAMDSNRGNTGGSIGYHSENGEKYLLGSNSAYGATFTDGDIVGVALNLDDNEVTFYKNNGSQGALGGLTAGVGYGLMIASERDGSAIVNFGQDSSFAGGKVAQGNKDGNGKGDFFYAPPTGFMAMCTSNLPTPTITNPEENFNTVLYTGTGSSNAITGVGFQPEMTMISERDESEAVAIVDILRGNTVEVNISSTAAQNDDAQKITAIGSDGFTVGTSAAANQNNNAHVSYHWKFGGSGSANSDGSVSSTVSVNANAGMSIVKYEGTGSATTVGHGLGAVPKMMWIKNIDRVKAWTFYHVGIGNTHSLSQTDAGKYDEDNRFNDTTPTSSVFSVGDSDETNYNGDDHIAYCFAEVDGYSRIGKYKGNGSADGTFVYTGFRPAWLWIKSTTANRENVIFDNKRNAFNVTNEGMSLRGYAETTDYGILDFLSNGFKLRASTNHSNENGQDIIYIAFAEAPFKFANAR